MEELSPEGLLHEMKQRLVVLLAHPHGPYDQLELDRIEKA